MKHETEFTTREDAIANRRWHVIDASDQVVGRLATRIAALLRGKGKSNFARHTDIGDFVIVVNADKVRFTGTKASTKIYHHHTGYIGGVKSETAEKLLSRKPESVLKLAVRGMLPKTTLGKQAIAKLKIYRGPEHPHSAQVNARKVASSESTEIR